MKLGRSTTLAGEAARSRHGRPERRGIASLPAVLETNPYQRLLYGHLEQRGLELAPSERFRVAWLWRARRTLLVLHFHWPQPYFVHPSSSRLRGPLSAARLVLFVTRLVSARLLRYRIVWTIHQVHPHESTVPRIDHLASLALTRMATSLLAHDRATARQAEESLRLAPGRVHVVEHGSYVGAYPPGRERAAVRAELGIPNSAFVFVSVGLIRAYKDLEVLLAAFSQVPSPDAVLIVAGTPIDRGVAAAVEAAAGADPRIKPLLAFVPDERIAELYTASDVAVIPRGDGGTSGALILALSFGVPAVAARTETYDELLGDGAAGWSFDAGDQSSLAAALSAALDDPDTARSKGREALERAKRLAWPAIAERFVSVVLE